MVQSANPIQYTYPLTSSDFHFAVTGRRWRNSKYKKNIKWLPLKIRHSVVLVCVIDVYLFSVIFFFCRKMLSEINNISGVLSSSMKLFCEWYFVLQVQCFVWTRAVRCCVRMPTDNRVALTKNISVSILFLFLRP